MTQLLPDAFYENPMLKERALSFYTDQKQRKAAAENKDENEKKKLVMQHGKKKVGKDWKKLPLVLLEWDVSGPVY